MPRQSQSRWPVKALRVIFVLALNYELLYSAGVVSWLRAGARRPEMPLGVAYAGRRVQWAGGPAANAGVKPGDELLAVEGQRFDGEAQLWKAIQKAGPGHTVTFRIAHPNGTQADARVPIGHYGDLTILSWVLMIAAQIVTPALCLAIGFVVAALRPRDPLAWLLLAMMMSFAQMSTAQSAEFYLLHLPDGLRIFGFIYNGLLLQTCAIWMLLFGVYFPERLTLDRRFPYVKWALIAPIALAAVVGTASAVGNSDYLPLAASLAWLQAPLSTAWLYLSMAAISGFFFAMNTKVHTASTADARRRVDVVNRGAGIALTPMFIFVLWTIFLRHDVSEGLMLACEAVLIVFPLTMAYAIVVHRAMDVRLVIRQGLQYALAQRGIRFIQTTATMAVLLIAVTWAATPGARRNDRLALVGAGAAAIVSMGRGADALRRWTDRRFFREAYRAEAILNELSESVRTIVETGPLLSTVSHKISESLHVERVAVLVKSAHEYRPEYSLGYDGTPPPSLPEASGPVRYINATKQPARVYFDDEDSWIYKSEMMTEDGRTLLRSMNAQVLLPLAYKDKLAGVVALGPKRSEEPYSATDLQLLSSVAVQTGLALENSQLTQAIASEVAQRERMNRELEIAREVQERLFPQSSPRIPGIDYAGHCRPALGVGGDYYDWLELPAGELGVAIGDVSGKGIPAALLMASLQASLRSQAISGPGNLAALMSNMNRLIFEATPANRYATFFYAQYDPAAHRLRYVNAGHNPPMLFRNGDVERLEEGGPVVGLFRPARYTEASVGAAPGDILVLFTDGISEAMNAADDEWGEERLVEAVKSCRTRPPAEMIDVIMAAADAFVAGAPQHDDMTLIVLKFQAA